MVTSLLDQGEHLECTCRIVIALLSDQSRIAGLGRHTYPSRYPYRSVSVEQNFKLSFSLYSTRKLKFWLRTRMCCRGRRLSLAPTRIKQGLCCPNEFCYARPTV
ncbi:hypothetical protein IAQ61_003958 [Plenodomus lingam]|uniref:uncharacterized protein n=1 Tax=Leptosphaeria maculans TaxID=5022 RepID=UPI0033341A9B|nr:hypothetical protein IAQ61_003958 [Plenodomus lingam]